VCIRTSHIFHLGQRFHAPYFPRVDRAFDGGLIGMDLAHFKPILPERGEQPLKVFRGLIGGNYNHVANISISLGHGAADCSE